MLSTDGVTYSTGFPLANHEGVFHVRGMCGRIPAGLDSNSPPRPSGHSDMPPPDTIPGRPQEQPGGRNAETRLTLATRYSRTLSTRTHTHKQN